jgi:outer membrane lipoprotein LolB
MKRALGVIALALGACASLPPPGGNEAPLAAADTPFVIAGRISARRGDAGVAGSFSWRHERAHDAIELSTPLGQTLARLDGGPDEVTAQLQDGKTQSAPTWGALTQRAFGVTIPIDGLASWIRALPRPGAHFNVERDAAGRVAQLRQDGWDIGYAYADDRAQKPFRVTLSYPGADPIEVRVVVDRRE